jgi:hypothetical protein
MLDTINEQDQSPKYRIGAVSQLTGIAVATLRIWQSRYAVVDPFKNEGGQRLYSDLEVAKLKVLKGLTHSGHSIGALSKLSLEALNELSNSAKFNLPLNPKTSSPQDRIRLGVVGLGLAARLEAVKFTLDFRAEGHDVQAVFFDLQEALDDPNERLEQSELSLVLVKLNTLQAHCVEQIKSLQKKLQTVPIGVIYNYAHPSCLEDMLNTGIQLKREPLSNEDLAAWIKACCELANPDLSQKRPAKQQPGPRFDPQALAYMLTLSSSIKCECPKHLAELISQINAFAQFCQECLTLNPKDQALHEHLREVAEASRSMLEDALQKIVEYEGIVLPTAQSTL